MSRSVRVSPKHISCFSFSLVTSLMMSSGQCISRVLLYLAEDNRPIPTAEGPLGTALLKICERTSHFTAHVGRGSRPQLMPAVFTGQSNPFYEEGGDPALCTRVSCKYFSGKSFHFQINVRQELSRKIFFHIFLGIFIFTFYQKLGFPQKITNTFFLADFEGVIHS